MDTQALLRKAFIEIKQLQAKLEASERARTEPIAIIGMACRFPGGANDPESFWNLLREGVDAITEVPEDRWDSADFYDPAPAAPGKIRSPWGGFIEGVDQFDAAFFGITPREAERMDPQQRLWLEVAWEALEAAGQSVEKLSGSRTGVFAGVCASDYMRMTMADASQVDAYDSSGGAESIVANRLSYLLDLRGPSVAVDTACSSSLVAVHLACQSLRNREADLAVAGGVSLILSPEISIALSNAGMLAPDGRCKTFDTRADGYVRGEGCGAVILKRLSDALVDRDPICAVIRGSAVNQDGRSNGLTAPNLPAQRDVLRQALHNAAMEPAQVTYVETHGTGTSLGDPIEVEALASVYERCTLGAVKANIGHLEGASGIAGLIKAVLALQHREIPPQPHFRSLNPNIPLPRDRFTIPVALQSWPSIGPRAAAVSSFGFGGTNAHIVLEEAAVRERDTSAAAPRSHLLPVSARSHRALEALLAAYADRLKNAKGRDVLDYEALHYSAGVRRSHHSHRAAFLDGTPLTAPAAEPGARLAFVFSGHGSQWIGMGRELMQREPVFRREFEKCAELFRALAPWPLAEPPTLDATEYAQPGIFAVQVALAALWRSWGIHPDAVAGHSLGEVAAAHVAGALSLEDALCVVYHRGKLMQAMHGQGRTAAVQLSRRQAEQEIEALGDSVSIAAVNGPSSCTVSGDSQAVVELVARLAARGVRAKVLDLPYAFHTPRLRPAGDALTAALQGIGVREPRIPIVPTGPTDGGTFDADYWGRQISTPVEFDRAIQCLRERDCGIFLELGGHPVVAPLIAGAAVLPSLRRNRPEQAALYESLGRLYLLGFDVNWPALYPQGGSFVPLPAYPWQRTRHWLPASAARLRELSLRTMPYLSDHRVFGTAVAPAAVFLEMAIAKAAVGSEAVLENVVIQEPLLLMDDGAPARIQWKRNRRGFEILSRQGVGETLHASGSFGIAAPAVSDASLPALMEVADVTAFYQSTLALGFDFGPAFRGVRALRTGPGEAVGEVEFDPQHDSRRYRIHPALLDACLQVVIAASGRRTDLYLPFTIDRLSFHGSADAPCQLRSHARLRSSGGDNEEVRIADLRVVDRQGRAILEIEGFRMKRASREGLLRSPDFYQLEWPAKPLATKPSGEQQDWLVVADANDPSGLGLKLAADLAAKAHRAVLHGLNYRPAHDQPAESGYHGVVYCSSGRGSCREVLELVQKLRSTPALRSARLWIISRGRLEEAPVRGLARVIALEYPDSWGGLIELADSNEAQESTAAICHELLGSDGEDQVRYRGPVRHVARLVHARTANASRAPLALHGAYLVTGGTGGVGTHVARWLAAKGATPVLVSRNSAETDVPGAIVLRADVAKREELQQAIAAIEQQQLPLRGVFHLAGVLEDALLPQQSWEKFQRVLAPKIDGARNLHELTRDRALDHFVMFSSGISLLGAEGQSSYAAANAYLDALAHHRREQGLPAISINWGPWAGAGMAAAATLWIERGVEPQHPARALHALERILLMNPVQVAVLPARWKKYAERFGANVPKLLEHLVENGPALDSDTASFRILEQLQQASPESQRQMLWLYVREQVGRVMHLPADQVETELGFAQLGMDSLMAVELSNNLQRNLKRAFPATLAFDYPNIDRLVDYLAAELHPPAAVAASEEPLTELLTQVLGGGA